MILAIQRLEIETRERKDNNMRSCNITTPRTSIQPQKKNILYHVLNVGRAQGIKIPVPIQQYTRNYQQIYQQSPQLRDYHQLPPTNRD